MDPFSWIFVQIKSVFSFFIDDVKTDLDTINDAVLVNIYLALKRVQGQNEKNWLSKISIENISGSSRMPMKKKESFWDKFRV